MGQAGKEAQFDQFGAAIVLVREFLNRFIEGDQVFFIVILHIGVAPWL